MIFVDGVNEGRREDSRLMHTMVIAGRLDPAVLLPTLSSSAAPDAPLEEGVDDSDTLFDYSAVTFAPPTDHDREMLTRLTGAMSANRNVTVTDDGSQEPLFSSDLVLDHEREWV